MITSRSGQWDVGRYPALADEYIFYHAASDLLMPQAVPCYCNASAHAIGSGLHDAAVGLPCDVPVQDCVVVLTSGILKCA